MSNLNIWETIKAPFATRALFGGANRVPAYNIAVDNGFQDYAFDPTGQVVPTVIYVGPSRGRTNLNNPDGVSIIGFIATPGTPTVTPTGGSASTWAYKIVARSANATTAAGAAGQTTTGAATLTGSAYNTVTWAAVSGAIYYDVYRTTAATSPTSTGLIATIPAFFNGVANLTVVDTGLAADGSTAPTVNTTGSLETFTVTDLNVIGLAAPQNLVITQIGTAATTNYSYKISAVTLAGTENATMTAVQTTTGAATLTSVNANVLTWKPVPGARSYNIYRTASSGTPSTTGLIGNVIATSSFTTITFTDTGIAATGSVPTTNTTGGITASGAVTGSGGTNFIATENGANNAIATAAGSGPALSTGLEVTVQLAHTLQAGANTFAYNGGSALAIKSHYNVANNIATVYAATGVINLFYNGTLWLDMAQ